MRQYSVVLSGFDRGEEFFRGRMMKQGMKVAAIERVIQSVPCILKQGLSLDEAKRFEGLFRDAGAIVAVHKDGTPIDLPAAKRDERRHHSQPRLTPLVPPLPAPPEEPPPPPALIAVGTEPGVLSTPLVALPESGATGLLPLLEAPAEERPPLAPASAAPSPWLRRALVVAALLLAALLARALI